jgi:hypothetical protein
LLRLCAGTSLGDPIEVGALAAALVEPRLVGAPPPLALNAAKSWSGHAEPGAGMVGLVHAQATLAQAALLPILHLHNVNPYVTGDPRAPTVPGCCMCTPLLRLPQCLHPPGALQARWTWQVGKEAGWRRVSPARCRHVAPAQLPAASAPSLSR